MNQSKGPENFRGRPKFTNVEISCGVGARDERQEEGLEGCKRRSCRCGGRLGCVERRRTALASESESASINMCVGSAMGRRPTSRCVAGAERGPEFSVCRPPATPHSHGTTLVLRTRHDADADFDSDYESYYSTAAAASVGHVSWLRTFTILIPGAKSTRVRTCVRARSPACFCVRACVRVPIDREETAATAAVAVA